MTRDQISVILDVMVSLDGGSRQISHHGDYRRDGAGSSRDHARIYHLDHIVLKEGSVKESKNRCPYDTADRALNRLFRTQLRSHLVFTEKLSRTVGESITSPGA